MVAAYKYYNQLKWLVYQQQHQSGAWFIIIVFIKALGKYLASILLLTLSEELLPCQSLLVGRSVPQPWPLLSTIFSFPTFKFSNHVWSVSEG